MKLICLIIEELGWTARPIHFFHFHQSSLPNGKIDWEMKRNDGQRAPLRRMDGMKWNPTKQRWVSEPEEIKKIYLLNWRRASEAAKWDWLFSCVGFVVFGWVIGWLASQWLRPREDKPNQQHKNKSIEWSRLVCEWIEWRQSKSEFIDGMKELNEINQWTLPLLWRNERNAAPSSNSCAASSSTKSNISFSRCARRNVDCCWMGELKSYYNSK